MAESQVHESPVPFWGLMAFTFILLIAPQNYLPVLGSLRIAFVAAVLALSAYLLDRILNRRPLTILTREIRVAGCLAGWAVLTVPFSYWPGGSASLLLDVYFKSLVIFWLLSNTVNNSTRLRQIAWGLSLMAAPLGLTALTNYRSGLFMPDATLKRIIGYDAPLTGNPNDLALMLDLIFPLTMALFVLQRRRLTRTILLGIICLEVIGVILTLSRAGFLTLAATFPLCLWKFRSRLGPSSITLVLVVVLVAAPFVTSTYIDRLATITDIESDPTGSSQDRWRDMVAATKFFLKHPIVGSGVGMNILALNEERGPFWKEVHNVYLVHAAELGFPGLLLFLTLLVGCIKATALVQRRLAQLPALPDLFYLAAGIEASLIAFALSGFFYPAGYHFNFYYFAGLAVAARCICESAEREQIAI